MSATRFHVRTGQKGVPGLPGPNGCRGRKGDPGPKGKINTFLNNKARIDKSGHGCVIRLTIRQPRFDSQTMFALDELTSHDMKS